MGKKVGTVIVATHETTTGVTKVWPTSQWQLHSIMTLNFFLFQKTEFNFLFFPSKLKQYVLSSAFAFLNKHKKKRKSSALWPHLAEGAGHGRVHLYADEGVVSVGRQVGVVGRGRVRDDQVHLLLPLALRLFVLLLQDGGAEGRVGEWEGGRADYFTDYYFQCPFISFSML